jgi:glycosyltransferase involved in cell wall biosynthesis
MSDAASDRINHPLITIVTVNLNNAKGLERTIASLAVQTFGNWEHVIQDGGSTDDSVAVINRAADSRRTVISEHDGGIYQGMNKGLARATGNLVWFLNSGDEFQDDHVLATVAESWNQLQWRWAYGSVTLTGHTPSETHIYRRKEISRRRVLLGIDTYPHPSCIYELSLLREIGDYRPEFGPPADQELCLRAELVAAPQFIDEVLSIFDPGGSASGYTPRQYEELFRHIRNETREFYGGNAAFDYVGVHFRSVYRNLSRYAGALRRS